MAGPTVYTLGRLIVDLYANQIGVPLSQVSSFNKYLGGSAANTAVGLARLGASVGLISRVGPDEFGKFLRDRLQQEGVDTGMLATDPVYPTGLAFAALFPPNDSQVLFYRKPCADANLSLVDIDFERLREARMLVVACTALAVSPGREAALAALEANRNSGGVNVLDLDWRPMFWASPEEAHLYYRTAMRLADVVLANEPELEFAGGSSDPDEAAQSILKLGVREVVAKRGGAGVRYYGQEGFFQVPAVRVEVMNTLGAGDGFGAAYTYGLLEGWPVERRLRFAAAAGAIVVSRHSCSDAMPTRAEVEALLAAQRGWS
ncbi:MAG: 5-dehydro-2-deoxygluconokinase [Alicyclobacillus macrosporangiidus]|uniref:5-dehydro-2-deoxygluconokinase n=1 Tax=Alicyclobacillus macrosporangiidus TaxID=392015 RepID=UPI0026ED3883|nr:5-dehydro-2-deoxygluconokinase [Alicyclobacillus macrosporangiidus]MCL6600707.1 5-dehydro-2-deoxygluconokinase [Alicyclobacillus macrosporangiidus]